VTAGKWLFRVASRPEAGAGHIKRCLVLADTMRPLASAQFLLDTGGESWLPVVHDAGHDAIAVADWNGTAGDGVVLDQGDAENAAAASWRSSCRTLVVFRDGVLPIPGADVEISQWQQAGDPAASSVLCGLEYAIVERSYCAVADTPIDALPNHVLISFGYRDSPNATTKVLRALDRLKHRWKPNVSVVLGGNAPHLRGVEALCRNLGAHVRLRIDPNGLAELLTQSDLVIGAGGVSAVERAAAGRPSLTITLNALQQTVAQTLARVGATHHLGELSTLSDRQLDNDLMTFALDQQQRARMARTARQAIDGAGAARVARHIQEIHAALV